MTLHIARAADNTEIEADCGCNLAPCGLVVDDGDTDGCAQHSRMAQKPMRQLHAEADCLYRWDNPA